MFTIESVQEAIFSAFGKQEHNPDKKERNKWKLDFKRAAEQKKGYQKLCGCAQNDTRNRTWRKKVKFKKICKDSSSSFKCKEEDVNQCISLSTSDEAHKALKRCKNFEISAEEDNILFPLRVWCIYGTGR